jgi:FtsH-binding integral membrane protein
MSYGSQNPWSVNRAAATGADYDLGLRKYMLSVYNYMASGLALTGVVAWLGADSGVYASLRHSPLLFVIMLAPIALVWFLSARIYQMRFATAQLTFWAFSALMGLSLSSVFLVYTGASIAETFFIAASTFLALSLYGYTTRTNLAPMGAFMFMGLIGILLASLVNWFIGSSALQFAISVIGVLVFAGLTAWDTQRVKQLYDVSVGNGGDAVARTALMGALTLYLDFINLFLFMLQFFGQRRD